MTTTGEWGEKRCDDGSSRSFGQRSTRALIAEVIAVRDGWAEIRPGHWAEAGAIEKRLRTEGRLADLRRRRVCAVPGSSPVAGVEPVEGKP